MTNEEAIKILNMVEAHGHLVIQAKELAIKALSVPEREKGTDTFFREATKEERESVDEYIKSVSFPEREKGTDLITLKAQGLDEGIRCAMCTNSMANDRGCDGGCVVDTAMYKRVLKVIEGNTVPEREKGEWNYKNVEEWANEHNIVLVSDEWYEKAHSALSAEREKTMKLSEVYKLLGADMRGGKE